MDIPALKNKLAENHRLFTAFVAAVPDEAFLQQPNGKWSAGQLLEHIYLSVKPVRQALSLPKYFLRLLFGKANRPSRTYATLVEKYQQKLAAGGRAPGRFVPRPVPVEKKEKGIKAVEKEIALVCEKLEKYTEAELDTYILPHPLLGKLTLREMMYFTIYHVSHHLEQLQQNSRA
ncbi:MAG TPA: DinB family protein [Chitinophagaceae bacterium]|nr:DinB family protein [Chitinophagaceae bacterium]